MPRCGGAFFAGRQITVGIRVRPQIIRPEPIEGKKDPNCCITVQNLPSSTVFDMP